MWNGLPTSSVPSKGKYILNSKGNSALACTLYISVSILMTLINKLLYTNAEYKFPFPFFTTFFQLNVVLCFIVLWTLFKPIKGQWARFLPSLSWDGAIAVRVAPLTIVYVCVVIFNPMFLQHVEVTTYTVAHAFSIGFMIFFSYLMLKMETSTKVNSACLIIMCGTCIGSMGYLNFSVIGAFYSLAWPIVLVVYRIYLKRALNALNNDIGCLIYYNTIMSILVLSPFVILSGELGEMYSKVWFWDEFGFWLQMLITSFTAFAVQIIMMVFLVNTTPLTLTVASVSKGTIQTIFVSILFGNRLSLLNVFGLFISLLGSYYYSYLSLKEPSK